mmetsp:Transcript_18373/g.27868  ORF Transcript_18373/g.27868 Transcript_18373/m.27868 type:complete len:477 (-) Transcript_18373:103-1533(-)
MCQITNELPPQVEMNDPSTCVAPSVHRYVPQGYASMLDDAPGWSSSSREEGVKCGPVCWKCKGCGTKKIRNPDKKKDKKQPQVLTLPCPICQGLGYVAQRLCCIKPGCITRGRKRPAGWNPSGPMPAAIAVQDCYSQVVQKANFEFVDVETDALSKHIEKKDCTQPPEWLPQAGEELCNLVGNWRILQKVGSHRWTTDDLVTSYVALDYTRQLKNCNLIKSYLDLGTGNASVLQMVTWGLLGREQMYDSMNDKARSELNFNRVVGVEARSEAVALAKRSLQFNLGKLFSDEKQKLVSILQGDFRDISLEEKFDLITGTPPYFQVSFSMSSKDSDSVVSKAVIHEGGMPTSKQSAPARCEFRGGMEAYCQAASRFLSQRDESAFIVCENWLNHDRTLAAAKANQLRICKQIRVHGRENKGVLFCVYVMKRAKNSDVESKSMPSETLVVRTAQGDWTQTYKETVLKTMSIPYIESLKE